jgi:hypothetical protein
VSPVHFGLAPPDGVDHDMAHDARRVLQEHRPAHLSAVVRFNRADKRFVHQGRGVQKRIPAIPQLRPREASQRRIVRSLYAFRHRSLVTMSCIALPLRRWRSGCNRPASRASRLCDADVGRSSPRLFKCFARDPGSTQLGNPRNELQRNRFGEGKMDRPFPRFIHLEILVERRERRLRHDRNLRGSNAAGEPKVGRGAAGGTEARWIWLGISDTILVRVLAGRRRRLALPVRDRHRSS